MWISLNFWSPDCVCMAHCWSRSASVLRVVFVNTAFIRYDLYHILTRNVVSSHLLLVHVCTYAKLLSSNCVACMLWHEIYAYRQFLHMSTFTLDLCSCVRSPSKSTQFDSGWENLIVTGSYGAITLISCGIRASIRCLNMDWTCELTSLVLSRLTH